MALLTAAEAKTFLGITDTTHDAQIATWIPYVEDDIVDYLGHAFQDGYVYRESASAFVFKSDTGGDYITDDESEFLIKGFADGMDIVIEGGYSNVGLYTIDSAASSQLTLEEAGELIDQDQNDTVDDHYIGSVRISRVKWPKALKPVAAKMVWYQLQNAQEVSDAKSERLDDYSVTFAGSRQYPERTVKALDTYRRPAFG